MHKFKLSYILIFALLAAWCASVAIAGADGVVSGKIVLSVSKLAPGKGFDLAMVGSVKDSYHIGAADSSLYPAKLTLSAPAGIRFGKPLFPAGTRIELPFAPGEKIPVYEGRFIVRVNGMVDKSVKPGPIAISAKLDTQACKGEQCYPPQVLDLKLDTQVAKPGEKVIQANTDIFAAATAGPDEATGFLQRLAGISIWAQMLLLFGAGLLMAFTPCVYPMVPVTVGYFSSQAGERQKRVYLLAGAYVGGLALMYSGLGVFAALTGSAFGSSMQNPAVISGITLVLVALALSMFGLYELQPPAFIMNRSSGRSGILGAVVMGLLFGVVAAPCAGPVVLGLMLYVAKIGSPLLGLLMFLTLSLGFGTPLFLLAAFSAKMPVPGMWMVAVKKIAGFLLLGAAAHFAEPLLPLPIGRYMIPAVVLAGGIYLGFFEKSIASIRLGSCFGKMGSVAAVGLAVMMVNSHPPKAAVTWEVYTPQKMEQAIAAHKPVMLDFTADWCAVCRELEHGPFSDPRVAKASMKLVRLRVDASKDSPELTKAKTKYGVSGFPTVIFMDSTGSEIKTLRVNKYIDSAEMIRRMEQAGNGGF